MLSSTALHPLPGPCIWPCRSTGLSGVVRLDTKNLPACQEACEFVLFGARLGERFSPTCLMKVYKRPETLLWKQPRACDLGNVVLTCERSAAAGFHEVSSASTCRAISNCQQDNVPAPQVSPSMQGRKGASSAYEHARKLYCWCCHS